MTEDTTTRRTHRLGLHVGEAVHRLANFYPTLVLTLVETVQNAIDANARKVFLGIDMKHRLVITLDDGDGVTVEQFDAALESVCKGVKSPGSIGRFGLGMISPLNKCRCFVFASQPDDTRGRRAKANVWTFISEEILAQSEVEVPSEELRTLPAIPRQFMEPASQLYAGWHTMVRIEGITDDRVISDVDLDELEHLIRSKLEIGMRDKGTTVHIVQLGDNGEVTETRDIDPEDYTGEPLEVLTHDGEACGRVTFELYRARKTGGQRKGQVRVMRTGDNSPITWGEFHTQALRSKKLKHPEVKEALDTLGSGYFEGMVSAEHIELEPHRTLFELGDALDGLYVAIYAWYLNRGKDLFENERETRQELRYQELGARSLARVMEQFKSDARFAAMAHRLIGVLPEIKAPSDGRPSPRDLDRRGKEAPKPSTPKGGKRVVVNPPPRDRNERQSTAPQVTLSFAYELLEHSSRLWEFEIETGVLTFNVRHPIWVSLDETKGRHTTRHDRQIMHLQEWLSLQLLLLLMHYDEPGFSLEVARRSVDEQLGYYPQMFIAK